MELSIKQFKKMIKARDVDKNVSIGAFDGEKLVGIMLVGSRVCGEEQTAYDICIGVIKEYRNQKITSEMFEYTKKVLKKMGIHKYILEVIKSNDAAVHLYKKQGFKVIRELNCFYCEKDKMYLESKDERVYNIDIINNVEDKTNKEFEEFWDFNPSWQNSTHSINVMKKDLTFISAKINNKIVGYGVVDKLSGDIMQLAVDKNYRRQNIGHSILMYIFNIIESKGIYVINVDSTCDSMKRFLNSVNLQDYVDQYEMCLEI